MYALWVGTIRQVEGGTYRVVYLMQPRAFITSGANVYLSPINCNSYLKYILGDTNIVTYNDVRLDAQWQVLAVELCC